jgi:hypothetical protein
VDSAEMGAGSVDSGKETGSAGERGLESFDDVVADESLAEFVLSSLDSLGPTASYPWYLSNWVLIGLTGIIWMCILSFIITRYGYGNDGGDDDNDINGSSGVSTTNGDSFSRIGSEKGLLGLLPPKEEKKSGNDSDWDNWWDFKGLIKPLKN